MKISVLGCGWLGLPLAKKLTSLNHSLSGSTTSFEKIELLQCEEISPFLVNISDYSTICDPINNPFWNADILIISIPPRIRKNPIENHLLDLKNLIQFLNTRENKPWVFYTSTTGVYDFTKEEWCKEDSLVLNPPYKEIESIIENYPKQIIFRLAGLVDENRLIINFLSNKIINTNSTEVINLIHKDDVIKILTTYIMKGNFIAGEIYNICSDTHPLKTDFYTTTCLLFNIPPPIFNVSFSELHKKISSSKLKKLLQYELKYPSIEKFYTELKK